MPSLHEYRLSEVNTFHNRKCNKVNTFHNRIRAFLFMAHLVINLPQINMSHVNTRHKIIVVLNLFCEIALVLDLENAKQEKNWVELTTSLFFLVWHCRILCFGCWINRCLQHNNLFRLFLNSLDWNISVMLSVTYIPSILLLITLKLHQKSCEYLLIICMQ